MDFPGSEIVNVIYALLPGFLAAWIFYALTAHPKQGPFERVVQALIFTGIVQAVVFFPDNRTVASGSYDKHINIWDVTTGQIKVSLTANNAILSLALSPNGKTLASGGSGR